MTGYLVIFFTRFENHVTPLCIHSHIHYLFQVLTKPNSASEIRWDPVCSGWCGHGLNLWPTTCHSFFSFPLSTYSKSLSLIEWILLLLFKTQSVYSLLSLSECSTADITPSPPPMILLGRKVITNLDSILKSRDITLSTHIILKSEFSWNHWTEYKKRLFKFSNCEMSVSVFCF